jgi:hypothetical protein
MITITKDKIYRSPFTLKKTRPDSEEVEIIPPSDLIYMLGDEIELGEDVTFKTLFDIIILHKDFLNILFAKEMHGYLVDDFIEDYEKDIDSKLDDEHFDLRLAWYSDIYKYNQEVEFVDYVAFEAFGRLSVSQQEGEYPISLAFISLAEIKNKLVKLDNTFELHDDETYKSEIDALFKANYKALSVYEVLQSILREITFYGKPDERDRQREELQRQAAEFDELIHDEDYEEDFQDWDEVEDEIVNSLGIEDVDEGSYWDLLYPDSKRTEERRDKIDSTIIAISEGAGLSLEEQLQEAHDSEDYETAAKLKKLIDKKNAQKDK